MSYLKIFHLFFRCKKLVPLIGLKRYAHKIVRKYSVLNFLVGFALRKDMCQASYTNARLLCIPRQLVLISLKQLGPIK